MTWWPMGRALEHVVAFLASKSGRRFVGGCAGLSLGWLSLCAGEFSIAMRWNVICMQDVFVAYRNFLTEKHAFL